MEKKEQYIFKIKNFLGKEKVSDEYINILVEYFLGSNSSLESTLDTQEYKIFKLYLQMNVNNDNDIEEFMNTIGLDKEQLKECFRNIKTKILSSTMLKKIVLSRNNIDQLSKTKDAIYKSNIEYMCLNDKTMTTLRINRVNTIEDLLKQDIRKMKPAISPDQIKFIEEQLSKLKLPIENKPSKEAQEPNEILLDNICIRDLNFTLRAYTALTNNNIVILKDLLEKTPNQLKLINNLGGKIFTEIEEKLLQMGFKLKDATKLSQIDAPLRMKECLKEFGVTKLEDFVYNEDKNAIIKELFPEYYKKLTTLSNKFGLKKTKSKEIMDTLLSLSETVRSLRNSENFVSIQDELQEHINKMYLALYNCSSSPDEKNKILTLISKNKNK